MRKFFLMAMLFSSMVMSAQEDTASYVANNEAQESNEFKADPGKFMMEVGFSPIAGAVNEVNLMGGQLRAIYIVSEKIELKLGLGFGINKVSSDNGEVGDAWAESSTRVSSFSINPGFNYLFKGTPKLEPYIGAELGFGMSSSKSVAETKVEKTVEKNKDINRYNTIEVSALTGFNYFFAKNIFVGVEVGLGVGVDVLKGSYTETELNGKTEKEESVGESHEVSFTPLVTPTIRLGWAF